MDSVPISSWKLEEGYDSDLLMALPRIDFAAVVAVIFSLMAVLLGHDGLCGERERGTLRLLLANPVEGRQVVRAKLAGGMISLSVPLAAAFALCLLVLLVHPAVRLSGEDCARLALLLAVSCLFLAQIHALSLMVSSLVRRTETALIICLIGLAGGRRRVRPPPAAFPRPLPRQDPAGRGVPLPGRRDVGQPPPGGEEVGGGEPLPGPGLA